MPDLYLEIDALAIYQRVLRGAQHHSLNLHVVTRDYLSADANLRLIVVPEDHSTMHGKNGAGSVCKNRSPTTPCSSINRLRSGYPHQPAVR
jgi:hypothetical protein